MNTGAILICIALCQLAITSIGTLFAVLAYYKLLETHKQKDTCTVISTNKEYYER